MTYIESFKARSLTCQPASQDDIAAALASKPRTLPILGRDIGVIEAAAKAMGGWMSGLQTTKKPGWYVAEFTWGQSVNNQPNH